MIFSLFAKPRTRANSVDVANMLLACADEAGTSLTPMQLLKLVYLCHGWMLGLYGKPLISEGIEAWRYGPVIRELYDGVKQYRSSAVRSPIGGGSGYLFSKLESELIKDVFNKYGHRSGVDLSSLTHRVGSPWDITWKNDGQDGVISNDLIEHHCRELASIPARSTAL